MHPEFPHNQPDPLALELFDIALTTYAANTFHDEDRTETDSLNWAADALEAFEDAISAHLDSPPS